MNMNTKCALQNSNQVKKRVKGINGPDRKNLPSFANLVTLSSNELKDIQEKVSLFLNNTPIDRNDINNENRYTIAQACKLKSYFPKEYKQYLFQDVIDSEKELPDEWEYVQYQSSGFWLKEFVDKFVSPHFRARIAVLPPGKKLDWHIDTNTSYACRLQIIISGSHRFMVRRKREVIEEIMRPGEIWFCNTGYNHKVEVIGDEPRVAILLGCHYDAIKTRLPDLSKCGTFQTN